jgi:hypothetical protein
MAHRRPSLLLLCHPPSLSRQLHKHNMHSGEKFDATITNRMNGKDLGYDEFTGRFFEVRHSATAADAAAADAAAASGAWWSTRWMVLLPQLSRKI